MALVEGEDKRLGQIVKVRVALRLVEHLCEDSIAVGGEDKLYLGEIDHTAVEVTLRVFFFFICGHDTLLASVLALPLCLLPLLNDTTELRLLGLDAVDAAIDIDTVNNRFIERVVDHTVIVEESHCVGDWRGGEAYKPRRVKIFEHLVPVAIDAAVTLVNYDKVKKVMRQLRVVWQRDLSLGSVKVVIIRIGYILTLQEGEQTLDGADYHIAIRRDLGRLEPVDRENGVEGIARISQAESAELSLRLAAKVVAVDKEEDAPHGGVAEQAVGGEASRVCLASACCQHNQSAPLPRAETLLKLRHSLILTVSESPFVKRWETSKRVINAQHLHKLLGCMDAIYSLPLRGIGLPEIKERHLFAV